jgi:predicted nuclease with TOPRIM domain
MKKEIVGFIITCVTALFGWLYYRKEKKSDLQTKLLEKIEDLSKKYIELNEKYITLIDEFNTIKIENTELKNQVRELEGRF